MTTEQTRAVVTAGERLEQIESWSRKTFIASIVAASCLVATAVCLAILTTIAGCVAYDYLKMKSAMTAAVESFDHERSSVGQTAKTTARQPF